MEWKEGVMDDKRRLTRKDLYELVWSETQRNVAERLGIKTWHLTDLCERHGIPRPESGYWTKQRLGRADTRPDLPPKEDGDTIVFSTGKGEDSEESDILDDEFRQRAEAALAREKQAGFAVVVHEALRSPHPVAAETRRLLSEMDEDSCGVVSTRGGSCFDVRVTKSLLQRAVLLLDAFLKACDKRGYRIVPAADRWTRETRILVLGKSVPVKLREKTRRQDRKPNLKERYSWDHRKYEYVSTGVLTIEVGGRVFTDAEGKLVESRLQEVMVSLVEIAMDARRWEIRDEQRRRREMELQQRRAELRRLKEEEQRRVQDLYQQADDWERSMQIRKYVDAVRTHVANLDGQIEQGNETEAWLAWAGAQADRLDPLAPTRPSVLDEPDPALM